MLVVEIAHERLLLKSVNEGSAVLLLGAGASATSMNSRKEPVKLGRALAKELAERAGYEYNGESLPVVMDAVTGIKLSKDQIDNIMKQEFLYVDPSKELTRLFNYTWKRVYTWNIDDSIENIKSGVQNFRIINGMIDKVSSYEGIRYLQIIHLHGQASKPEHGFIFTPKEYNFQLINAKHDWYRQVASDYAAHTPIFIGSRLEEPILQAELDRARPEKDSQLGVAFLITPDDFTELELGAFAARNIVVLKGTLKDFIAWLEAKLGSSLAPLTIDKNNSSFTRSLAARFIPTPTEVDTAHTISLHTWSDAKTKADQLQGLARTQAARAFLEGHPPSWVIATTDIPVWLTKTSDLYQALKKSIQEADRAFLVYGQSGSGKTTALMQSILRLMRENDNIPVYEVKDNSKSLRASLDLISKLHRDEHAIVYIGDAFLYSDSLQEDIISYPKGRITVVSSARTNEWRQHIERRIGDHTTSFEFQRFVRTDYSELIKRLVDYVPAPEFRRMSNEQRMEKLAGSRDQLLIALKETTTSEKFTSVITDEFKQLPHSDCRILLLMVGVATIARTGISEGIAREAFNRIKTNLTFEGALRNLEGIVFLNESKRYTARHEVYVRHIMENVADFDSIIDTFIAILSAFTKFNLPIVKNVSRLDALLFKFILNHNFIADISKRRYKESEAVRLYENFEVDFQLDGHFWLQYGQYLATFGELEPALSKLQKSIAAYPENHYAVHALADLQLRVAERRQSYDSIAIQLMGDAATTLEDLHKMNALDSDYYPIVTLAERHIGALVKHKQIDAAKEAARRYFRMVSELNYEGDQLNRTKAKLMHFVTSGRWSRLESAVANNNNKKKKQRRRVRKNG